MYKCRKYDKENYQDKKKITDNNNYKLHKVYFQLQIFQKGSIQLEKKKKKETRIKTRTR